MLSGDPNSSNGVQGEFPEGYAEKLFDAFDLGTPFTLALTFANGERESILMHTRGGELRISRMSFHGPASATPVNSQCRGTTRRPEFARETGHH